MFWIPNLGSKTTLNLTAETKTTTPLQNLFPRNCTEWFPPRYKGPDSGVASLPSVPHGYRYVSPDYREVWSAVVKRGNLACNFPAETFLKGVWRFPELWFGCFVKKIEFFRGEFSEFSIVGLVLCRDNRGKRVKELRVRIVNLYERSMSCATLH